MLDMGRRVSERRFDGRFMCIMRKYATYDNEVSLRDALKCCGNAEVAITITPPPTQALQSKTFRPPPLDGSLTLPEIYDWHFVNTPDHRLFIFADDNQNTRTILWPEAVRAIYNGARFLRNTIDRKPDSDGIPIVAILAAADTITYFTMIMAIMRAGYIAFPISPRNSPSAVAHLIKSVGVQYVLVGDDQSMSDLADESLQALKANYEGKTIEPQLIPIPHFGDLFVDTGDDFKTLPSIRKEPNDIIIYLHSSGSTAYPKPIPWTNYRFLQLALIPYFGGRDLTNQIFSLHTMPMYHGMGVLQCCWTASSGLVVSAFEPKSPAQIPTPDNLFQAAVATHSDIIFCVPAIIEAWSRNPQYVKWLATRGGVLYGGGPLNKAAGDYMTSQGVSIFILYGSTSRIRLELFQIPRLVKAEMVPHGENTFEFVMVSNPYCHPSVINTKVAGIDAYATSDLMVPHPTKPGYWRIYGRSDDQIMHNTGEKTNPGPLEKDMHSRLFKEMILVAKPDKPFQYTAKSTARRQAIIKQYEDEIESVYNAVETTTQTNIPLPQSGISYPPLPLRNVQDDDDIFQHGCDSLQATWIRNALTRALRDGLQLDTRRNVDNFVYEYPSISSLATFLVAHASGKHTDTSSNEEKEGEMARMVGSTRPISQRTFLRAALPTWSKSVLLTGSTGGLGAFVLSVLVADEDVNLLDRQRASLVDKGLPIEILESEKVILLEGQLEQQQWGLEKSVYDAMQQSVTHIIHNAWPVDFNLALKSFEANIKGLRTLIDFALSSPLQTPPTLIYTSTIAKVAIGTGYTESKWVSEQILAAASAETTLRTVIVRVGQIAGGPTGFWNTKEWFPALVQSAKSVSCLPNVGKDVSWIPVQAAAKSMADFMQAPESRIVHLVHPKSTPWPKLAAVSIALKMDGTEHPLEAFGFPCLSTEHAVNISSTLVDLEELSDGDVKAWLAYWRGVGFI
ncbi:hypothetical protein BJ912DRAFT_921743 [Pholiota molesta]|nr:hypothetical protein BJ912DRAFT_921743 [Pholiota molesta]